MKKAVIQILFFGIAFSATLFFSEIFIRNTKIADLSFSEYYNDIGKGIAKPRTFAFLTEGFGITKTNKDRFIGSKNINIEKDTNTIRIALLGDSFIESKQVFERQYFGSIIQNNLKNEFPNKKIEVLNFGRSNFNIGHIHAYRKLLVDSFNPDYVLYFLSNDDLICDYSHPPLLPITIMTDKGIAIKIQENKNNLNTYQKTKILTQNSTLLNILNSGRHLSTRENYIPQILFGKFYNSSENQKIIIPTPKTITPDSTALAIIKNLDTKTIIINRDKIDFHNKFTSTCKNRNLRYWKLHETIKAAKVNSLKPYFIDSSNREGHWNSEGHKIVGDFISKKLLETIKEDFE